MTSNPHLGFIGYDVPSWNSCTNKTKISIPFSHIVHLFKPINICLKLSLKVHYPLQHCIYIVFILTVTNIGKDMHMFKCETYIYFRTSHVPTYMPLEQCPCLFSYIPKQFCNSQNFLCHFAIIMCNKHTLGQKLN